MLSESLNVISVNIWQILFSLANLIILFLIIKKFLFGPVERMLKNRQEQLDSLYSDAEKSRQAAKDDELLWQSKIKSADTEAKDIVENARKKANLKTDRLISKAKDDAEDILRQAEADARLEREKSTDTMKKEIVEISAALAEKILKREIDLDDHRKVIDECLDRLGDNND